MKVMKTADEEMQLEMVTPDSVTSYYEVTPSKSGGRWRQRRVDHVRRHCGKCTSRPCDQGWRRCFRARSGASHDRL